MRKEANHRVRKERTREHVRERRARRVSRFGGCVLKYEHNSLFPIQKHGQTLTCPDIANGDLSPVFCTNGQASKCDFYVKIAEKFTIFNVKIADQNLERGFGTERWHGETRRGRSAPGGASLAAVPVWGFIFDGLFSFRFDPLFFSPVTMISTDCSGCSALSVSLPNVVQRQQPLCPWPFKPVST